MRERGRGILLMIVSVVGLLAEALSTLQDGIGGAKVIVLACFAFLFWYGRELSQPRPGSVAAALPLDGRSRRSSWRSRPRRHDQTSGIVGQPAQR